MLRDDPQSTYHTDRKRNSLPQNIIVAQMTFARNRTPAAKKTTGESRSLSKRHLEKRRKSPIASESKWAYGPLPERNETLLV